MTSRMAQTMDKMNNFHGNKATVYSVRRDPVLQRADYIPDKNNTDFQFTSGSSYRGGWKGASKEGFGIEINASGTKKYEGEWAANARNGKGSLFHKLDGDINFRQMYAGDWVDGRMEGYGVYSFKNGDIYKGHWVHNKRSGSGTMQYANGDAYSGEWLNDVLHGPGVLYLENGNTYDGHFVAGLKEGPGKFYYASTNKVYEGEWVEDCPRCGEYRAPSPEELKHFRVAPRIRSTKFSLPELRLRDTRGVLDAAVAATRTLRAESRGLGAAGGCIDEDAVMQAQKLFRNLDVTLSGVVSLARLHGVFALLGLDMTDDLLDSIQAQLEISNLTEISFPEVIDITSFYLYNLN